MTSPDRARPHVVLHVPHAVHAVAEFASAGALLRQRGWRVVVLDAHALGDRAEAIARQHGFEWIAAATAKSAGTSGAAVDAVSAPGRRWGMFVKRLPVLGALATCAYVMTQGVRSARKLLARARVLLDTIDPGVVMVVDDRAGRIEQALLYEAKRRGLTTVVAPNEAMTEGREFHLTARRIYGSTVDRLSWPERLIGAILAAVGIENAGQSGGRKVFWRGPALVFAEWITMGTARNPWIRGGNDRTDLIAVSSEMYRQTLLQSGIADARMAVVGYPRHDEIGEAIAHAAAIRGRLSATLGIPKTTPLILIGVPDFKEFVQNSIAELISDLQFVIGTVRRNFPDHVIILARHPRIDAVSLRDAARELLALDRVYLPDGFSTYELVAVSEAYFPFYSGTTYGGLAAGKLVIPYDFTGSEVMEQFIGWSSEALFARTREQLVAHVELLADPLGRRRRQEYARMGSEKYGLVDGRNAERLAALLEGATVEAPAHPEKLALA